MASTKRWTADDLPDLSGQEIVITGANSGIGFEAARKLAQKGASVVLACRNLEKARTAAAQIISAHPHAALEVMQLDLAALESVRNFARCFNATHQNLHVLCNNAGVMALPYRRTADGFEMQFGTNHLGHFALTGLLLEPLLRTDGARVVTVSSSAHWMGRIQFDDLQSDRGYSQWLAYGQSKLANLLFTFELQHRAEQAGLSLKSVACHPGYAATNLQTVGARMQGFWMLEMGMDIANRLFAQSAEMGALQLLYAATAPNVDGGDYIGPDGIGEFRGYPTKVRCSTAARDRATAQRLWEISERLTGVQFRFSV
ncbi:MAG: SDR family oxidoreductase [Deltaproteobacteria bacterium]|nr:SDR family oxidoreductase [Deltaproteobacteria bacterium]